MRLSRFASLALVFAASVTPIHTLASDRTDVARELVVDIAAPRSSGAITGTTSVADLFVRLGLHPLACLADPLDNDNAITTPGLAPSRVWLVEAADSATAAACLATLAHDPRVAWVERNERREPAIWIRVPETRSSHEVSPTPLDRPSTPSSAARHGRDSDPHSRSFSLAPSDDAFPDDPLFRDGRQWALDNRGGHGLDGGTPGADVRARAAWRMTTGANHVLLAIADTGIDPAHPELGGAMPDGAPRITWPRDVVMNGDVRDVYGHGTLVAGVMAARTNDGVHFDSLGIAGVCGGDGASIAGCRLVPIKVTPGDQGVASSFDIATAVLYATQRGARAVNISFAGNGPSRVERLALAEAITHGCVPVAAAGNRGYAEGARPQYPAAYAADGLCVQAGASDANDRRAAFSSYGPGLDLVAPGVDVWTTFMTYPSARGVTYPGYVAPSGTSFAAPFVTGAIGLLAAARPELIDADFQHVLRESAHDIGAPGVDPETGWGRLDIAAALDAVSREIGVWHDEVAADAYEPLERDTLVVGEAGFGGIEHAARFPGARLVRASVSVAVPDSFVGPVRAWPRIGGTTTLRSGFRLSEIVPWAEVVSLDARRFTLRGYFYEVPADSTGATDASESNDLPLPRDQARFGFTVIGPVTRPRSAVHPGAPPAAPASDRLRLTAAPNPFGATTRIEAPGARAIEVWDVRGRRVRRMLAGGSVSGFAWNGEDERGRRLAPGVYIVRAMRGRESAAFKLLKLE